MAEVKVVPLLSPSDWKKRQLDTLRAVGEGNYKTGITNPKADTIKRGIETEEKYAREVKKAITEKRRAKGLKSTDLAEWYGYAMNIGAPRLVEGVTKREKQVSDFIETWQPVLATHVEKVRTLPEVTDAEREKRMLENLRGLKELKGTWR